jgi:hypothetical protein
MKQQPSTSDERRSELELIAPRGKETQPNCRTIYNSVGISRGVSARDGAWARAIVLSALFGLASAAVIILFIALALIFAPLVGIFSAVAMFAIVRHAQFRRVRTALARGKRI